MKKPGFIIIAATATASLAGAGFVNDTYKVDYPIGSKVVEFRQSVLDLSLDPETEKEVIDSIYIDGTDAAILKPSTDGGSFELGQVIDANLPAYQRPPQVYVTGLDFLDYGWGLHQPGNRAYQIVGDDRYPGRHDVIAGFRVGDDPDAHYGWMHVHRDSTGFVAAPTRLEQFATPYVPIDVRISPFPGQPIRAGFAPDLPGLSTATFRDEQGILQLHLEWPAGFPGVRLQRAAALGSPIIWHDVPTGDHNVTLPVEDVGEQYFRLFYQG